MSIVGITIHPDHFDTKFETCLVHSFVHIGPFLTNLVPIDRSSSGLSIGTNFVKNGPMLTKLWTKQVNLVLKWSECIVISVEIECPRFLMSTIAKNN